MSKKIVSKNGRKRSNIPTEKVIKADFESLRPVSQVEANMFQTLVQISNSFGKLKQQKAEYEMILASLKDRIKDVRKGVIKLPIMLPLGKNKFYNCSDKKYVLNEMDGEISILTNALNGIMGQLQQNYDAYIEAGLRIHEFTGFKFSKFKPKNLYSAGCNPNQKEKVLFEGELEDLMKDDKVVKKFHKACTKACELNKCNKERKDIPVKMGNKKVSTDPDLIRTV